MGMLTVRLDEETEQDLNNLMQAQDLSRSAIIKQLIHQSQPHHEQAMEQPKLTQGETHQRSRHLLNHPTPVGLPNRGEAFSQPTSFDVLIDAGAILSFYNSNHPDHTKLYRYIESFQGKIITSSCCIAEVMWALNLDTRVQLELLTDLHQERFVCPEWRSTAYLDIQRMLMVPPYQSSFTDLSLMAMGQQHHLEHIICLAQDFSRYQSMNPKLKRI